MGYENSRGVAFTETQPPRESLRDLVLRAVNNPTFDFRTAEGIARETGVPVESVLKVLANESDLVRISSVTDSRNRTLYASRSRPRKLREWISELQTFMALSPHHTGD